MTTKNYADVVVEMVAVALEILVKARVAGSNQPVTKLQVLDDVRRMVDSKDGIYLTPQQIRSVKKGAERAIRSAIVKITLMRPMDRYMATGDLGAREKRPANYTDWVKEHGVNARYCFDEEIGRRVDTSAAEAITQAKTLWSIGE